MNVYTIGGSNPPFSNRLTFNSLPAKPTLTLSNPTAGTIAGAAPTPNINTVLPYLPMASMNQWSFDVERALWGGAGLDVQYLGAKTIHLDRNYYTNTPLPGAGAIQARRPNQKWGVIRAVSNDMVENYDGLNVILRQRFNHGLSMLVSYTWSHTLDVGTDSNNSGNGAAPQDPYNWKGDYGNSNWDIRHRLVASYSYELPFFKTPKGLQHYVLGGWQINGVTTAQKGTPILLNAAGDAANTGAATPERPNLIAPAVADCGHTHLVGCITASSFTVAAPFTYGNAGRNIVKGPGLTETDFSVFKNLPLGTERARLQLRFEFFNLFNTPSFTNPTAVFGTATFGNINSTLIPNRQFQVAAKILF